MYSPVVVDTIVWYIKQTRGPDRIAFHAGWGQPLAQAMMTDFIVFYFAPDWRTKNFMLEVPQMEGRFGLMPLPAWEEGGRRTSIWGGTGLCITKNTKNPELAWEFAKHMYLNTEALGQNFEKTHVLPPLKEAWDLPELNKPMPYYGNQSVGQLYASLAPDIPNTFMHPYNNDALWKLNEAFIAGCTYYEDNGEDGLREFVDETLKTKAAAVQKLINTNVFYAQTEGGAHE